MPIKLIYDKENHLLLVKASGLLSLTDIQEAGQTIIHSEEYPPDIDALWDLREVDASNINREFFDKLLLLRQQEFPIRQNAKLAMVADNDLKYGLSRMYEMLSSDLQQDTHVFKTIEEARTWLAADKSKHTRND